MDQAHPEKSRQDHLRELSQSARADALPLTLWVRGDEDFATDFFLEADDVMQILGIKRSRLTQISGRELRVARRKMGRYIKPFYRESDVLEYKSWTRATAAHAKSKNLVDQAIGELKQVAQSVQEGFADQRSSGDLDPILEQILTLRQEQQVLMRWSKGDSQINQTQVSQLKGILGAWFPQQQKNVEQIEDLKGLVKQLARQMELLAASAAIQQQNVNELQLRVGDLGHRMQQTTVMVESGLAALQESLAKAARTLKCAPDAPKPDKGALASQFSYKSGAASESSLVRTTTIVRTANANKAWLHYLT